MSIILDGSTGIITPSIGNVSSTELNCVDGATGNLQTQINAKIENTSQTIMVKNWIINGQFDVWQRLAPGVATATTSGYNADDRWKNEHSGSTKITSKQSFTVGQTDVPNNPSYFSRTVVSSAGTTGSLVLKTQFIEDVAKLAGKTVTLSFWAKADASKNISIEFEQYFGTNGSGWVTAIGTQKFALTTTWQRFTKTATIPSTVGKTIGSGNWFGILFWFDAGSDYNSRTDSLGNQSGTFDIANVCLVEGSQPMECPSEPYAEVLRKCQRYYVRWGGEGVYELISGSGWALSATDARLNVYLPVPMRSIPTSLEFNLIAVSDGVASTSVSNAVIVNAASKIVNCSFTSTGLTVWRPYSVHMNNSSAGYLAFSAEL